MIGWSASILTKERLLKGPVLGNQVWWGKCTTSADGKPKYLALSKEMDTLSIKAWKLQESHHSNFYNKNLWVNKGKGPNVYWCFLGNGFHKVKIEDFN